MASHGTGQSGTGVFYQAMPAVGADGRNVMKLIPVQKVNGQFVPAKISPHKKDAAEPPRAITMNFASKPIVRCVPAFQSVGNGQLVKEQLSAKNSVPHPSNVTGRYPEVVILQNNASMLSQASLVTSRAAQGALQLTPTPRAAQGALQLTPTPRAAQGALQLTPTPRAAQGQGALQLTPTPRAAQGQGALQLTPTPRAAQGQGAIQLTPTPRAAQGALQLTPTPKSGTLLTFVGPGQLPVTVKSPVLPNGQYLQIPPNAQVKTLPMSALPPAIKRQIFTSTANIASNSKLPTVLYVSPVQTMNEGGSQCPTAAPSTNRLQKTSDQTPSASSSVPSTQCTRSVSQDSQKPVTPIRWVIEEQDGLPAPCLVPVNSTTMASDILKTLAEMEKTKNPVDESRPTAKKPQTPQATPTKTGQGTDNATPTGQGTDNATPTGQRTDNALVMCNGKVYFVANKTRELANIKPKPSATIGNVTSTDAMGSPGSSQRSSGLPSMPTIASVVSQASNTVKPQSNPIVIPDGPDEVIDLCDDDSPDDLSPHAISTTEKMRSLKTQPLADEDEDNVIFVSYIPPKSLSMLSGEELEKASINNLKAKLEIVNEQKLTGTRDSETDLPKESCQDIDKTQDMASSRVSATYPEVNHCQAKITDQGRDTKQSNVSGMEMEASHIASTSLGVELSTDASMETVPSQHVTFTLDMVNPQAVMQHQGTEKGLHHNTPKDRESTQSCTRVQKEETQQTQTILDPNPVGQTSVHEQEFVKTCDHLLKRMFGITSDLKIHLEKIDAKKSECSPIVLPQIGPSPKDILKGISKLIQVSKITAQKRGHKETQMFSEGTNEISPNDSKKQKMENASKASECPENMDESLISPSPQPGICVLNSFVGSENTNEFLRCPSPPPTEILCDAEAEQIFGHEEPVIDFFSTTAESEIRALPSVLDSRQVPKLSSNSPAPSVQPQTSMEAKDCSVGACSAASNNLETKPKRRRGRQRKCPGCPTGTHEQDMPISSPSTAREKCCSSKRPDCTVSTMPDLFEQSGVSIKEQREDYTPASVEIQCLSTTSEQSSSTAREISASDLFSIAPMDPDEIKRHEKIRRLKELLREKEAALAMIRKNIT